MKMNLSPGAIRVANEQPVTETIDNLISTFRQAWWNCETAQPDLGRVYSLREQFYTENKLDAHLRGLVKALQEKPADAGERPAWQERLAAHLIPLAKGALSLDDSDIQAIRDYGFAEVGLEFFRQAHAFDPSLTQEDIYQASRNVWSMNFIQLLTGRPIELTPAVFAYSLLYPYTDNYLDNPQVPFSAKATFNQRFRRWLAGETEQMENSHEARIAELVAIIESQFERSKFPLVYASLLAIHRAQERSLALHRPGASPYEVDVLGLSFEKGGAAVLADGYLVAGDLTPIQREWTFFYGVFTQLMDDLEDTRSDLQAGRLSVFSQTARRWPLDAVTNRTFHLGRMLVQRLQSIEAPQAQAFQSLIARCLDPLLIASAGELDGLYTRPYLQALEKHAPVRFKFLRKQRRKFARVNLPVMELAEAFVNTG